MICEACDDTGLVRFTKPVEDERYHNGAAQISFMAACLCNKGLRRARPLGAFTRIDKLFPLQVVERDYFPERGLPHGAAIEISDLELERAGIPKRMRSWLLDTYPDPNAKQLAAAREWLDAEPRRDLVLHGPAGTGKTGLAVGMLRAVHAKGNRILFVQANEWLIQLQSTFKGKVDAETELELLRPAWLPDVLVLDDLNARRADKESGQMSAYFADILQLVLNKRQGNDSPTILTTNLDVDEMQEFLTPTIFDRLREGEFWEFEGGSQRKLLPFRPKGGPRKAARKKR